jgi:beta-N-acetylhexosaminidase
MTPASLSERIVGGLLRGELGFDGAVITDALSMESVRERGEPGMTAVAALRAGCDLLLMPADLPAAYDAVLSAVESGSIPESRLDESVRRILRLKASVGLI